MSFYLFSETAAAAEEYKTVMIPIVQAAMNKPYGTGREIAKLAVQFRKLPKNVSEEFSWRRLRNMAGSALKMKMRDQKVSSADQLRTQMSMDDAIDILSDVIRGSAEATAKLRRFPGDGAGERGLE